MEELLDVYTRDGEYLGVKTREECHDKNADFYHKPAWTWVYNSKGEVLVQKRASGKKMFPNYWDMSCAGHVDAGETTIAGVIREAKEEIGIDVEEKDCRFMFEYIEDRVREIGQVYFIKVDKEINEFIIQKEEVSEIKWLNLEDFKKLFYSEEWVPYQNDYKDRIMEEFKRIMNM